MYDFLVLALLAGLAVAVAAGPLGSMMVWQRMAYFGDTLAHSALLGIALGLWLSIASGLAVVLTCLTVAILLIVLEDQNKLAGDTVLGILSHTFLAMGLVAITLVPGGRTDMEALLFGDILAVTPGEVLAMWAMSIAVLMVLKVRWQPLLAMIIQEDLANVEGVNIARHKLLLKLMLAMIVAISMKIVGVLLITALLIIPAATARRLSSTPEQMALRASALAATSVCFGMALSWFWNIPAGPAMVLSAAGLFALVTVASSTLAGNPRGRL
jgi:zinc transport system permease protein